MKKKNISFHFVSLSNIRSETTHTKKRKKKKKKKRKG